MPTARIASSLLLMPNALMLPLVPLIFLGMIAHLYAGPNYKVPEQIPYWAFFFGLPHIVSSFQTMCDKEYLVAYQRKLVILAGTCCLPLVLVAAGVPAPAILTVILVLTVHHVVAQQCGIALSVARLRPNILFILCKWSTVLLGTLAFLQCYGASATSDSEARKLLANLADLLAAPLMTVIIVTGGVLTWQARARRIGAWLMGMNIALFVISLVLISQPSSVLIGLMLMRILHDITGFVVYIGHDSARNQMERKNLLYRAAPFLPIWVLNPLYALVIASALTYLASQWAAIGWLVVGITLAHYYSESFVWRGNTPHRQNFRLAGP